jgi:uncharacterized protein (UPF0276 family)
MQQPSSPGNNHDQPRHPFALSQFPALKADGLSGASFKPEHLPDIMADLMADSASERSKERSNIFFEIHAENYMGAGGMPHAALSRIRQNYPVSLHGVAMNIGAPQELDRNHLHRFAGLVERYQPCLVSEHLAWSTHDDIYFNDLLPVPYTDETLARIVSHIGQVQDAIKRPMLLENPSSYLQFEQSNWSEADFIREIARRSGCGLLLDINNVFVSATNNGTSATQYLADFPLHLVGEIHLAGHDAQTDDEGDVLLIDTHDREVSDPVWALYRHVLSQTGPVPTLVEWDADVPQWAHLKSEALAARHIMDQSATAVLRHVA